VPRLPHRADRSASALWSRLTKRCDPAP
jgi:hypothetical protein